MKFWQWYSIWKVHRNCWPLCRRCFLWLHIIYSFHVNLWVSGVCMYHVDSAKLICRLGTYELKVVSKSHSNFLISKTWTLNQGFTQTHPKYFWPKMTAGKFEVFWQHIFQNMIQAIRKAIKKFKYYNLIKVLFLLWTT